MAFLSIIKYTCKCRKQNEDTKREQTNICSLLCFPIKKIRAIMNPATGECRFTPFVGVVCVTLFEKLSLLIAAATLAVNIMFLITK